MNSSSPSRNTSVRKPSHFGSKIQLSPGGSSLTRLASIGRTGGLTGRSILDATRLLGYSATRLLGYSATRLLGYSAARQLGSSGVTEWPTRRPATPPANSSAGSAAVVRPMPSHRHFGVKVDSPNPWRE